MLCKIANLSLATGVFPDSEKFAMVTPILKKRSLDKEDLKNYRPVCQLSFVSKFVERVVSKRVDHFLFSNALMPSFQSAYRQFHSTETMLVHLSNHLAVARSKNLFSCLVLLDLSAAFDTVDHVLLLDRLSDSFRFTGTVLAQCQ